MGKGTLSPVHQALVHIMVELICIKIWMVKDPLYKVFQFSCVGIVSTDVPFKNACRDNSEKIVESSLTVTCGTRY
jgi:hypothetical protein